MVLEKNTQLSPCDQLGALVSPGPRHLSHGNKAEHTLDPEPHTEHYLWIFTLITESKENLLPNEVFLQNNFPKMFNTVIFCF